MSDKKNNKNEDELFGFREFLEDSGYKRPGKSAAKHAGFELLSFLEIESARLDKQQELLAEKSSTLKTCDAFEALNRQINREISLATSRLSGELFKKDSTLMKSLEELLKSLDDSGART